MVLTMAQSQPKKPADAREIKWKRAFYGKLDGKKALLFNSTLSHGKLTFGDVNGDGVADVGDVTALMDHLGQGVLTTLGLSSTDIDHSGAVGPADILREIDLINHGWGQALTPPAFVQCP